VELHSSNPSSLVSQSSKYRTNSKCKLEEVLKDKIKIKNLLVGVLEEGSFLGDCELALGLAYAATAVAKSSKVRAYACDERIILSQMTPDLFACAASHYQRKLKYREDKPQAYQKAKSQLQRRLEREQPSKLSPQQQQIKRIIASRYVEPVPSIFGRLSPR
jgi:CRP-like cAMP-binding protein